MGNAKIDTVFITVGLIVLLFGMAFGGWMGSTDNFQYADAHAHMNLLGFVLPTLYGLMHRVYPGLSRSRLAWPQCIAHFVGVAIFIPGLLVVGMTGNPLVVIVGASVVLLSTATFAYLFITGDKSR